MDPNPAPASASSSVHSSASSSAAPGMARAIPKSVTLTEPSRSTIRLPGVTSRWTRPRSCACARALVTSTPISRDRSTVSGVPSTSRCDSGCPSIISITRYGRGTPSMTASPTSWTWTTPGWLSRADDMASARKAAIASGSITTSG